MRVLTRQKVCLGAAPQSTRGWRMESEGIVKEAAVFNEAASASAWKPGPKLQAGGPAPDPWIENSTDKETVVLIPAQTHSDAEISPGLPRG